MPATTTRLPTQAVFRLATASLFAAAAIGATLDARAAEPRGDVSSPQRIAVTPNPALDRSGKARTGQASYYADFFAGRKMANGERFRLDSNNAASRTLPFGTLARVTNLENGRSAVVVIKDRGPYVEGRIVDVSPGTAKQLDMLDDGVVAVEAQPLALPPASDEAKRAIAVGDAGAAER
jgi:rare lipoprotein A